MLVKLSYLFKGFIALSAIIGILLQCEVSTPQFSLASFRMFTTLSNLVVALFFIAYLVIYSSKKKITNKEKKIIIYFKFMISMSITLTGLVAHFMLKDMFTNMDTQAKLGLTLLHYVVPISTILDWIIFDEKGNTDKKMPLFATIFPITYVAITMIAAQFMTGENKYPYPFLNIDMLGVSAVCINIFLLAIAFLTIGYLAVWLDHKLAQDNNKQA